MTGHASNSVLSYPTAGDGIAEEESQFDAGRPAVLLWQSETPSITVPGSWTGRDRYPAVSAEANALGWPLATRSSGGGVVPQGPCTLNVTMVTQIRPGFSFEDGYRLICDAVSSALLEFGISSHTGTVSGGFCDGTWNINVGGRKLAGTAQRWRPIQSGGTALSHAAILLSPLPEGVWSLIDETGRQLADADGVSPFSNVALLNLLPRDADLNSVCDAIMLAATSKLAEGQDGIQPMSPQATLSMPAPERRVEQCLTKQS